MSARSRDGSARGRGGGAGGSRTRGGGRDGDSPERRALPSPRRIVVKIGSSSLTGAAGGLDDQQMANLARQIAAVQRSGIATVLVSSGAIAAGLAPLGFRERPSDLPSLQAAASVGQGILMHVYRREFHRRRIAVGQVLLTKDDIVRRRSYLHARHALERLFALGAIPIVNENDAVAVEEIRFGDNDRIAALVANMIRADLLILLTDIDGLYSDDPRRGGATLIPEVADVEDLRRLRVRRTRSLVGSGGMSSKIEAVQIATASGVGVVIANARRRDAVREILAGDPIGTYFPPHRGRAPARKLWIAYAQPARGTVLVDGGARDALIKGSRSLLPAGIVGHRGSFAPGDAVEVSGPDGEVFAKGIVNYRAEDLPGVQGRRLAAGAREVIHRDSLVIL